MAESKGALIAKTMQKHAGRAKEKLLQNLGKVDKTADEIFDEHVSNFTRQQNSANRLQKELNNYIRCVRALQASSKNLMDIVNDVYEMDWVGHDLYHVQAQNVDMLWQDFSHKLADQVLIPLNTYQSQFPEMRKKVDKRGRKLVDYDSQRHNFQALKNNPKKRDGIKIDKCKEQLEDAKRTYEVLNSELHDELPALYESRILFLVTNLQTLFAAEQVFHDETAKVYSELEAVVDKLTKEHQKGSYMVKRNSSNSPKSPTAVNSSINMSPVSSPMKGEFELPPLEENDVTNSVEKKGGCEPQSGSPVPRAANGLVDSDNQPTSPRKPETSNRKSKQEAEVLKEYEPMETGSQIGNTPNGNAKPLPSNSDRKHVEELYDIPIGATTDDLPHGVLYRVRATYKYNQEDVDELSFDVGEVIQVVEYDDPEEQEEGWLMGVKETSGDKGLFPANFTRPI